MTDQWFSLGILFTSTNKTDHHDITEIMLKVALNTITLTPIENFHMMHATILTRKYMDVIKSVIPEIFVFPLQPVVV